MKSFCIGQTLCWIFHAMRCPPSLSRCICLRSWSTPHDLHAQLLDCGFRKGQLVSIIFTPESGQSGATCESS